MNKWKWLNKWKKWKDEKINEKMKNKWIKEKMNE